jgi:tripeptide aminopeptidase
VLIKKNFMQHIIDRFISYVTVDTESDPNSETTPSTAKQWVANQLVEEKKHRNAGRHYR